MPDHNPQHHDDVDADDRPPPRVADLKSGLGCVDPTRYHNPPYPPHWTPR